MVRVPDQSIALFLSPIRWYVSSGGMSERHIYPCAELARAWFLLLYELCYSWSRAVLSIRANSVHQEIKWDTNPCKFIQFGPYRSSFDLFKMYHNSLKNKEKIFSIAPMMDWTDRHCRFFHRQLSSRALLYTEMVTADAVVYGERERLIGYSSAEHPLALQLGGSDPVKLAEAARIAVDFGYDEINLNVGCPSDRVQSGAFGACLMREPELVGRCVDRLKQVVNCPVTVKCRLGVDDQDIETALDVLAGCVVAAGVDALWVHARKAWLQGLSPKQNRDVPPLDYDRVYRLKRGYPELFIGINGGIGTIDEAKAHCVHVDGVMLGRVAYQDSSVLCGVDHLFYGEKGEAFDWDRLLERMISYCHEQINMGVKLSAITRHMIGLFHGRVGARRYRQILSEEARVETAQPEILRSAFSAVFPHHDQGDAGLSGPEFELVSGH